MLKLVLMEGSFLPEIKMMQLKAWKIEMHTLNLSPLFISPIVKKQEEVFNSFQADLNSLSNDDNGKDSWILFQVLTIVESFDCSNFLVWDQKLLDPNINCSVSWLQMLLETIF